MKNDKKVQFNLSIPEYYRDQLRRMAAQMILEDPGKVITAASLGTEIICRHLDNLEVKSNRREEK